MVRLYKDEVLIKGHTIEFVLGMCCRSHWKGNFVEKGVVSATYVWIFYNANFSDEYGFIGLCNDCLAFQRKYLSPKARVRIIEYKDLPKYVFPYKHLKDVAPGLFYLDTSDVTLKLRNWLS